MEAISFDAPVVERGVGVFETILLIGRRAALWEEHVERLVASVAPYGLPVPDRDEIVSAARRAAAKVPDGSGEGALRLTWLALGANLDAKTSWRLDASTRAIPPTTSKRRAGSHAIALPANLQRDTPGLKSTSYMGAVLGLRHAMKNGGDEGLFVAHDGSFIEGTAAGLVAWDGGQLVVSPHAALPSVTTAAFVGSDARRAPLTRSLLRSGALVLGSLTTAAPLLSIDGEPCEVPAAMMEKIRAFNQRMAEGAVLLGDDAR